MKLRRSKPQPTARRRLSYDDQPPTTAASYRNLEDNVGRLSPRAAAQLQQSKRSWRLPSLNLRQRRGVLIVIILATFISIDIISLSTKPTIRTYGGDASQPLLRNMQDYQQSASSYLGSSLLNRNKLTIDASGLRKSLLAKYPEISDVTTTLPLLSHHPTVYIEPVKPAVLLAARNGNFVVGDSGKVLLLADNADKSSLGSLQTVNDQSIITATVGQQVLAVRDIQFIKAVSAQFAAKQQTIASVVLPSGSSELDVYLSGQPYFAKFNMQSDTAREQAGTLFATQSQLQKQGITPAKYIDVRLEGRAYYQ